MEELLVILHVNVSRLLLPNRAWCAYRDEVEWLGDDDIRPVQHPDAHLGVLDREPENEPATRVLSHHLMHIPANLIDILAYGGEMSVTIH